MLIILALLFSIPQFVFAGHYEGCSGRGVQQSNRNCTTETGPLSKEAQKNITSAKKMAADSNKDAFFKELQSSMRIKLEKRATDLQIGIDCDEDKLKESTQICVDFHNKEKTDNSFTKRKELYLKMRTSMALMNPEVQLFRKGHLIGNLYEKLDSSLPQKVKFNKNPKHPFSEESADILPFSDFGARELEESWNSAYTKLETLEKKRLNKNELTTNEQAAILKNIQEQSSKVYFDTLGEDPLLLYLKRPPLSNNEMEDSWSNQINAEKKDLTEARKAALETTRKALKEISSFDRRPEDLLVYERFVNEFLNKNPDYCLAAEEAWSSQNQNTWRRWSGLISSLGQASACILFGGPFAPACVGAVGVTDTGVSILTSEADAKQTALISMGLSDSAGLESSLEKLDNARKTELRAVMASSIFSNLRGSAIPKEAIDLSRSTLAPYRTVEQTAELSQQAIKKGIEPKYLDIAATGAQGTVARTAKGADLFAPRFEGSVHDLITSNSFRNSEVYKNGGYDLWWEKAEIAGEKSESLKVILPNIKPEDKRRLLFWQKGQTEASPGQLSEREVDQTRSMRIAVNQVRGSDGKFVDDSLEVLIPDKNKPGSYTPLVYKKVGNEWIISNSFGSRHIPVNQACIACHKNSQNNFSPLPRQIQSPDKLTEMGYSSKTAKKFFDSYFGK